MMKKYLYKMLLLALILLLSGMALYLSLKSNNTPFIPLRENTISCSINFTKKFGDFELLIKNISNKRLEFSKPRMVTILDIAIGENRVSKNEFANYGINSLVFELKWDINRSATLIYSNVSEKEFSGLVQNKDLNWRGIKIRNETVAINPGETLKIIGNMKSSLVTMHGISSFDKLFSPGETEIDASLKIFSANSSNAIAESKAKTFKAKYIGP